MSRRPPPIRVLVDRLRGEIQGGFDNGDRFWSNRQLMERFRISSSLAQKVTSQLVGMGHLRSEHRSGTYVVKHEEQQPVTIAFLYGEWQSPIGDALHFGVFNGAAEAVAEAGMALQYVVLRPGDSASLAQAASLQADGVILSSRLGEEVAEVMLNRGLPTVAYRTARPGVDSVLSDYVDGARQAVLHLAGLGHRRIAMLQAEHGYYAQYLDGYRRGLDESGLPFDPELVWSYERTQEQLRRLAAGDEAAGGATAIFLANDSTVLQMVRDTGVRIPDQISVVGFEDRDPAGWHRPRLTTLGLNPRELGLEAARRLIERLRGTETGPPRTCIVPVTLIVRESSRQPAAVKTV